MLKHTITLEGEAAKGARINNATLKDLLALLQESMQRAIRFRIEGSTELRGRHEWLEKAASFDLDLYGAGLEHGSTKLVFEVPTLKETIPDYINQEPLWPELQIRENDTSFSILEGVIQEAEKPAEEQLNTDRALLKSISNFGAILQKGFNSLTFNGQETTTVVSAATVNRARELRSQTPPEARIVISGILNQLTSNTRSFKLLLSDGRVVKGILPSENIAEIGRLWSQPVTVDGWAVYSASKALSHINSTHIAPATPGEAIFEVLPRPRSRNLVEVLPKASPLGRNLIRNVIGKWPGEESEEEIQHALAELS